MTFQIPEDLTKFSVNALQGMIEQAELEYTSLKSAADPDTVTDEQLDRLKHLSQFFRKDATEEIASRQRRAEEFGALDNQPEGGDDAEDTVEDGAEGDPEPVAAVVAAAEVVPDEPKVRVRNLRKIAPVEESATTAQPRYSTLIAAAGVPDYEAGQQLDTMLDVAKAFESRAAAFSSMGKRGVGTSAIGPQHYPVAKLVRDYPDELTVNGDEGDYEKLLKVSDEKRLPGGSLLDAVQQRQEQINAEGKASLVAAAGWCAPSETDYSICLQITTDGLLDVPEVTARRGGIRHNTGIEFDAIFGSGTGFFDLTEAQVAAGTTKTCLEIPCPSFTDTRLGVTGVCLTGNILSVRGYPEFTAAFTRGALAASAHQINREQIIDMVTDSTAVDLTGVQPWLSDGSYVSQVMSAVELAITDIKYRLRLSQSATLEVILPYWVKAGMRADWIRRNGGDYARTLTLADSEISSAFAARGARAQYVYDWQDAFSNVSATGMGADTPVSIMNRQLQFLVYPAGTWVRAVQDVITLNAVYDSTQLATNQFTHLFTETGWAMLRMCPVSRVYTVQVCPNGRTTLGTAITCP